MLKLLREYVRDFERRKTWPVNPIARSAYRVHSHGKQDGILDAIFTALGISSGTSVEIGAWDGITHSNTRNLLENGWTCGYIEADPDKFRELKRNIEGLSACALNAMVDLELGNTLDDAIDRLGLPGKLTFLCVDIDGNDYWVWKSLTRCRPQVVCIEYNAYVDPLSRLSVPYEISRSWEGDFYYGASAGALYDLARDKGYAMVGFEPGLDLFFVREDVLATAKLEKTPLEAVPWGLKLNPFRRQAPGKTLKPV